MAEPSGVETWVVEDVPDVDALFYRVHVDMARNGLHPGVFREQDGSMSTDWDRYSTAAESRLRAKRPDKNGVIKLVAGVVREIAELRVVHNPEIVLLNRAHTDVLGIELKHGDPPEVRRVQIREQLFRRFDRWWIDPAIAV